MASYLESLLGEHERIVRVSRQHWFLLASSIFVELALVLIILAVAITAAVFIPPYALIIAAIGFVLILLPLFTMLRDIMLWSNRQFVITNRRVMQISGVLNKQITDSSLDKVNDVKMEQSAFGRMFDYGDIEILTASELGANLFPRIERPVAFKTAMLNAKEQLDRGDHLPRSAEGDIPTLINRLDQLRKQGALTEEEFQRKKAELLAKL
jgi:uncharacterized membrane protein YdbT with pleckstrin-like domain